MRLIDLLDPPSKLPSIPKVIQQLIESFSNDDITTHEIASQISTDPAMTAKLLQMANSAYFNVSRTVSTTDDALRMLGFAKVRSLLLGNGMMSAFRQMPGIDLKQFWLYSLYTAVGAKWIAGVTDVNTDMAFTLGLLHGIGQLQMHVGMPAHTGPLDKHSHVLDANRFQLEKTAFGFHHGEVAAELSRIWRFPEEMSLALSSVQDPLQSDIFSEGAACVHLAAWRARVEIFQMSEADILSSYPFHVGEALNIEPAWLPVLAEAHPETLAPFMPPYKELTEGMESMLG